MEVSSPDTIEIQQPGMEDGQNGILHKVADIYSSGPTNGSAPITRLPDEILAEIFHQGHISAIELNTKFRSMISLVTRHWRAVVVDMPSLWSRLMVESNKTPEYVEMHLRRSKDCPLTIVILQLDETELETLCPIITRLTHSSHRWHKLDIYVLTHVDLQLILSSLRDLKAPFLESISVTTARFDPAPNLDSRIFTGGAPRLREVQLDGLTLRQCWPPLDNVTEFYIGTTMKPQGAEFYEMLEALPCVNTLTLADIIPDFDLQDIKKITLPFLRHLSIYTWDARWDLRRINIPRILADVLLAPSLEELSLTQWGDEFVISAFTSLSGSPQKFPALTSLLLIDSSTDGVTHNLLTSLPRIQKLTLIRSGIHVVELLLGDHVGPVLLPHLHTVTYEPVLCEDGDQNESDRADAGLLCNLVAARARHGVPLKKLKLHTELCIAAPEHVSWLQERVQLKQC